MNEPTHMFKARNEWYRNLNGDWRNMGPDEIWAAAWAAATIAEREACAKVCDEEADGLEDSTAGRCADRIRMRSNVKVGTK